MFVILTEESSSESCRGGGKRYRKPLWRQIGRNSKSAGVRVGVDNFKIKWNCDCLTWGKRM